MGVHDPWRWGRGQRWTCQRVLRPTLAPTPHHGRFSPPRGAHVAGSDSARHGSLGGGACRCPRRPGQAGERHLRGRRLARHRAAARGPRHADPPRCVVPPVRHRLVGAAGFRRRSAAGHAIPARLEQAVVARPAPPTRAAPPPSPDRMARRAGDPPGAHAVRSGRRRRSQTGGAHLRHDVVPWPGQPGAHGSDPHGTAGARPARHSADASTDRCPQGSGPADRQPPRATVRGVERACQHPPSAPPDRGR